jgi:hypothetical protein
MSYVMSPLTLPNHYFLTTRNVHHLIGLCNRIFRAIVRANLGVISPVPSMLPLTRNLKARSERGIEIAVGTHIAMRPPHKTGRAAFPHPAPTSGV